MHYEGRVLRIFLNDRRGVRKIKTDSETFDLNHLQRVVSHCNRKDGGVSQLQVGDNEDWVFGVVHIKLPIQHPRGMAM